MATAAVRKFISINPKRGSTPFGTQIKAQTIAYNRLGGTLTGIGQNLANIVNMMEFQKEFLSDNFLDRKKEQDEEVEKKLNMRKLTLKKKKKEENLAEDLEAEEAQEIDEDELNEEGQKKAEKVPKKKLSWMEEFLQPFAPIASFLGSLLKGFVAYKFFNWLGDEKNTERIQSLFKFFAAMGKMVFNLVSWGMDSILTGIGNIFGDKEPGQTHLEKAFEGMFGVFKIIGGMASFWLASRMLMPWKLLSDVKAMKLLGSALTIAEKPQPAPPTGNKPKFKNRKFKSFADRVRTMRRKLQVKVGRTVQNVQKTIKNIGQTGKNIWNKGKNVWNKGKGLVKGLKDRFISGGGGKGLFGRIKDFAGKKINQSKALVTEGAEWVGKQGQKFGQWADDLGKSFSKNINSIVGGIKEKAAAWAKKLGDIVELAKNPAKLADKVKGMLKGKMEKLVKGNKTLEKLMKLAKNPKEAVKAIKGMVKGAAKNKNLLKLKDGLTKAKAMKIGGLDAIIAAILGVVNYTMLGESPINAIVNALSGLVGYTAGFAIGAPFGGAPGFITGMAGAWVGEQIGNVILKGLAMTDLAKWKDPIMNDGRMMVRDPWGGGGNEEEEKKEEIKDETPKTNNQTTVIQRNEPGIMGELQSGERHRISNALYRARISAGLSNNDWDGNPAYEGDIDLILENPNNYILESGRVKAPARDSEVEDELSSNESITGEDLSMNNEDSPYDFSRGGTVPWIEQNKRIQALLDSPAGEKIEDFAINTKDKLGGILSKIGKPFRRKTKQKTITNIVVARQQIFTPGKTVGSAAPAVIYADSPMMLSNKMK